MNYDRRTILSLKLRSTMALRKLTRAEFFTRMQVTRTIEPITSQAYKDVEEEKWRSNADNSPHGQPWHVSFHASQFPGDDPMACPRKALYQMMDFPPAEPFSRRSRTVMSAGKAIEVELVKTWHEAGILLSAAPDAEIQTGFELPEVWLTGSVDAIILPPRWNKPVPVEIKSKYQADIELMKIGARGPDDNHVAQIKVQLALVKMFQGEMWPGLDPVTHGYIYYLSRDKPDETAEFRVDLDERFFEMGLDRLRQWKAYFEEDFLPEIRPGKRDSKFGHPNGWRWSYQPCQWCNFKKTCQLDFQAGEQQLSNSVGVNRAKLVRPDYDPAAARQRVLKRWATKGGKIPSSTEQ